MRLPHVKFNRIFRGKKDAAINHEPPMSLHILPLPVRLRPGFDLLKQTIQQGLADNVPRLGAALAFYGLLSLVPLFVLLLSAMGWLYGKEAAHEHINSILLQYISPQQAQDIQKLADSASQHAEIGVVPALLNFFILIFGASSVFNHLQDVLNFIWKTGERKETALLRAIRERLFSFAMMLGVALILIGLVIVNSIVVVAIRLTNELLPGTAKLAQVINLGVSFAVMTCVFACVFKVIPDRKIFWGDVFWGAVLTAFLFAAGQFAISLYLTHANIIAGYGAAGSIVALMLWIYYSAQIFFFGAEFTHIYASRLGSRKHISPRAG